MKLLDEFAFQQQSLRLAADDVKIEIVNGLDQCLELQVPAQPPRRLEILAHPLAQVARLAHVDNRPETVAHQVNARFVRHGTELFADVLGHLHSEKKLQGESCALQVDGGRSSKFQAVER